ncbi:MAG: DegV family protein [Bacilli bacterium]|nr:DegV family protein [Bacilli bacterium]
MKIAISTESQIDLDIVECRKRGIHIINMQMEKDGVAYQDNEHTLEQLFEYTSSTGKFCHTAAPNIDAFERYFEKLLGEYDEIVHIALSSAMSSTYQNAMIARNDNPKIHVIDSLAASGGCAIYVLYAVDLLNAGYGAEEIVAKVSERIPHIECSFQIDTLEYLYRGGRCNKVTMLGANILRLRPEIVCGKEGKLGMGKLHRGPTKKVVKEYYDRILSQPNIDKHRAFIEYSTLDEKGMALFEECKKRLIDFGFEEVVGGQCASPIAAYHAGPGIIGSQFFVDGPHPIEKKN